MARHITSLKIDGYRGLRDFAVDDLADVNILLGDNNCGKTSVLEVLDNFSSITMPARWLNMGVLRKPLNETRNPCLILSELFNVNSPETPISITYTANGEENQFHLSYYMDSIEMDLKSIRNIDKIAYEKIKSGFLFTDETGFNEELITQSYNHATMEFSLNGNTTTSDFYEFTTKFRVKKEDVRTLFITQYEYPYKYTKYGFSLSHVSDDLNLYDQLISVLQIFDPDIEQVLSDNNVYKIASRSSKKAIPVSLYGDGLKLALSIFSALPLARDGFLLIDEFDTSLHTSQIGKVLNTIIKMCKTMNIQLFMTTHSLEAVDEVIKCCSEKLDDLRVIRLNKKEDRTYAKVIDGKLAAELRNENDAELR